MKSILIQEKKQCFLCGSHACLESHHIFGGANRKWSEKYGLKVWLCHACHNEPPYGVHYDKRSMDNLRRIGQYEFEKTHTREEFMRIFGRNYL